MRQKLTAAFILLIVSFAYPLAATGQPPFEAYTLQILESDAQHVLLQLTLNNFERVALTTNNITYTKLSVQGWPNWGQAGEPKLPMYSLPLGMPQMGTPRISIIDAEYQNIENTIIYPNPILTVEGSIEKPIFIEKFTQNNERYAANALLPGPLAEAAEIGYFREQPVFQLRIYPFQYNPARQNLSVYHRLKILLVFPADPQSNAQIKSATSSDFEPMLQRALSNYSVLPKSVRAPVENKDQTAAKNQDQAKLSLQDQAKLSLEQAGLYRVGYSDLQAAAPTLLQADPRNLQLSNQGNIIPIYFTGDGDGVFDSGDSFIFYGEAIESVYTTENIYWLADTGQPGARMAEQDVTPNGAATPADFSNSGHYEQDKLYWQALPDGAGKDHWFWDELVVSDSAPDTVDYTFDLNNIAASGPDGQLRVSLRGHTGSDHITQLYLNGAPLLTAGEKEWFGQIEKLYTLPVSQALFVEGANTLRVEITKPNGYSVSKVYVDWFELSYQDTYIAEDNVLTFSAPATDTYTFEVTNFSGSNIDLFDITNPITVTRLANHQVQADGGAFKLRFSDAASPAKQYLARQSDQLPTPTIEAYQPSNWQSPDNGATYIIITHPDFISQSQDLADYRTSQGETVALATTQEIYDEFYDGIYDPQAIKNFLEYAYVNWSPQPIYVLLVGDASMDPKNNRGSSKSDLLPAYFVEALGWGEAPNDAWYAKVHGNDVYPDLIVGRISARWGTDVEHVTDKAQAYEQSPPAGNWLRRAVLAADDDDVAFQNDMETIANLLPSGITPVKMYDYDPTTGVQNEVNTGALILAYSGHGSANVWGKWNNSHRILDKGDVQNLSNGNLLPFVTVANCLNGYFSSYSSSRSMGEEFLLGNNKGSIAVWAPSSYTFPSINQLISQKLYEALLVDRNQTLAGAATGARIESYLAHPEFPLSLYETFTFLGDPAVRLNLPAELELTGQVAPNPAVIGGAISYTLSYTVAGTMPARGLTLVNTLPDDIIFQSAQPPPSSSYAQIYTWNLGDTVSGAYTIAITGQVKMIGPAHGETTQNIAVLSDNTGFEQTAAIEAILHDAPIENLSANNTSPVEFGNPVALSAYATGGTNVMYTWNFGDGSPPENGPDVQHTYPAVDTYTATVTAANGVSSPTQSTSVIIGDVPPVASYITSSPDLLGQPTAFESASQGTNLSYQWNFGDGTPPLSTQQADVSHAYASAGSYQTALTITNILGESSASATVTVLTLPQASFNSSAPDVLGQPTVFTNTSQTGGDDEANMSYLWNFGDGASSAAKNPVHTYSDSGTYNVSLTTYNSVAYDVENAALQITDVPIAGLNAANDSPTELGGVTQLAATVAAGSNVSYVWDFGDGFPLQNGAAVQHIYPDAGVYTARVTATNSAGSQSDTTAVTISDIPPLAAFSSSSPDLLGQATLFQDLSSGSNLSYHLNFGDSSSLILSPSSFPVSHTYAAAGNFTAILTASNSAGSDSISQAIKILAPPTANFGSSAPDTLGQTTTFTNTSQTGGDDASNVSYLWNFGDGHFSVQKDPLHTYNAVGSYPASLTVSHSLANDTITRTIIITDAAITGLSVQNDGPTLLGSPTALSVSISGGTNVSYQWNLGDDSPTANGQIIQHIYPAVGSYTARVTVANSISSQSQTTTVVISDIHPAANFISSSPDRLGTPTLFENFSSGTNLNYTWSFGDSSPLLMTQSLLITHYYGATGVYTVALITGNSAGSDAISQTVEITSATGPPAAAFTTNSPTELGQASVFINASQDGGASAITYTWQFGDGAHSAEKHPLHIYGSIGAYTVWLTVSTVYGANAVSNTVVITDAPIAGLSLAHNSPVALNWPAVFTVSTTGGSNIAYHLNFGDSASLILPSSSLTAAHTYSALGDYTVTLTAANSTGSQTLSDTISVIDEAITGLTLSANSPTTFGKTTIFTPTVTSGSNITYYINFGDGASSNFPPSSSPVSHTYAAPGGYSVSLLASNSQGSQAAFMNVSVVEQAIDGLGILHTGPTSIGSTTAFSAVLNAGSNVNYRWNFGDGATATGQNVSHLYSALGDYTVTLTAANSLGSRVISSVVALKDIPIAGLSINSDSPTLLGSPTHLAASISDGTNVAYRWNFGDGAAGLSAGAVHTYTNVGPYTVILTASNTWNSQTVSQTVTIFEWDEPIENLAITSSSPDFLSTATVFTPTFTAGTNLSYFWDFGDGFSSTLSHPARSYGAVGTYTAVLIASNNQGSVIAQATVSVSDMPVGGLRIIHSSPTLLGEPTSLAAETAAGTNLSYLWDFGDGITSTLPILWHTYAQTGSYTVALSANNAAGSAITTSVIHVYEHDEPISNLSISTSSPTLLHTSTLFTAAHTSGSNIAYLWNFGDGASSALQNPTHTYSSVGYYTVVMTAANSWGSQVKYASVSVLDTPISNLQLTHSAPALPGQSIVFSATIASGSNVVYSWNFGDSQTASGPVVSHTYAAAGVYEAGVTVSNSANVLEASALITVTKSESNFIFLPLALKY